MKNRATYDFNGIPVEFFTDEKDIYMFANDVFFKEGSGSRAILDLPQILKVHFKRRETINYTGERGAHKPRRATASRPTLLVKTSAFRRILESKWNDRPGAKDLSAFLQLVDEDMRVKIIGRVPTPTKKRDLPERKPVKQKEMAALPKTPRRDIRQLEKRVRELEEKLTKKRGFFGRLFFGNHLST